MPVPTPKRWCPGRRVTQPSALSFLLHDRINLRQAFLDRHSRISPCDPVTQRIKSVTHPADTGKQFSVHQHSDRLAILVNDDAVVVVLDLVQHLPKILAKIDRVDLSDHGPSYHIDHIGHYGAKMPSFLA